MADVKAEIYFFEIAMKRDGDAFDPRVLKKEPYHAHVSLALVGIEHRPGRDQRLEDFPRDLEVEHRQIPPFGREKWFGPVHYGLERLGLSSDATGALPQHVGFINATFGIAMQQHEICRGIPVRIA